MVAPPSSDDSFSDSSDFLDDLPARKETVSLPSPETQWPLAVHQELTELHRALQQRHQEIGEREAVLQKRELALAQETALIREALAQEANRLIEERRTALEKVASAHHKRLDSAIEFLREQCSHLLDARSRTSGDLGNEPSASVNLPETALKEHSNETGGCDHADVRAVDKVRSKTSIALPGNQQLQRARAKLRDVRQQLTRSNDLLTALLSLHAAHRTDFNHDEAAQRNALLSATEALIDTVSRGCEPNDSHMIALLHFLWSASTTKDPLRVKMPGDTSVRSDSIANPVSQWARKLLRFLSQAAASVATPLFYGGDGTP
ncbi:MAG: hypothetical protein SGPRY_002084, partial [Prymnesium sp.]